MRTKKYVCVSDSLRSGQLDRLVSKLKDFNPQDSHESMEALSGLTAEDVLLKPLEFGNPEQIKALRILRAKVKTQEERARAIKDGILKKYDVTVCYSGKETVEVWGTSEQEACEIGREKIDPFDFEIDSAYAREINL